MQDIKRREVGRANSEYTKAEAFENMRGIDKSRYVRTGWLVRVRAGFDGHRLLFVNAVIIRVKKVGLYV